MDFSLPPPVPTTPPTPSPTSPAQPPGAIPPPSTPAPSAPPKKAEDEAQQQARALRAQEMKRLEALLPKQATDSKIVITRISGFDGRRVSHKPVMTILISDLEEAIQTTGVTSEEYIKDRLLEKFDKGKFRCQVLDRTGRPVAGIQPFVMSLDDDVESDDEEEPEDDDQDEDLLSPLPRTPSGAPMTPLPTPPMAPPPPPPPSFSGESFVSQIKKEKEEEKAKTMDFFAALTTAQQSNQQMMLMFMQQMQQQQQAMLEASRQAAEAAASRSAEMWKSIITVLGPVVANLLQPKESVAEKLLLAQMQQQRQLSPEMQLLIEQMKSQNNTAMFKEVLSLQTSAATAAIETQAKLTSTIIDSALAKMQQLSVGGPEPREESTLETIAKIAAPVIAAYMSKHAGGADQQALAQLHEPLRGDDGDDEAALDDDVDDDAAPADPTNPPPPRAAPAPAPQAPPAPPVVVVAETPPPPPPQAAADPAAGIKGTVLTIVRMLTGDIPPSHRWRALAWCLDHLPPPVIQAIERGDEAQVLQLCAPAVAAEPMLLQAFADPAFEPFLRDAVADMQRLLKRQVTEAYAKEAVRKQAALVRARSAKPADASVAPDAPRPEAAPPSADAVQAPPAPPSEAEPQEPAAPAQTDGHDGQGVSEVPSEKKPRFGRRSRRFSAPPEPPPAEG